MTSDRTLELAADALARLDLTCSGSSPSASLALEIAVAAELLGATPEERLQLIAAQSEGSASASLRPELQRGWTGIQELQRRARSGARLSLSATLAQLGWENEFEMPGESTAAIDAILHEQGSPRAALSESAELATHAPAPIGSLLAALHLVSRGLTDRLRFLPAEEHFLGHVTERARALTRQLRALPAAAQATEGQLDQLGRAAITARAVLSELHASLALTVPQLADALDLSRPAIHDACDRLAELGLIRECTGRARGRVYAAEAMLAFALPPNER